MNPIPFDVKKKPKNNEDGIVYSTNPAFQSLGDRLRFPDEPESTASSIQAQDLRIWLEKRNGKPCTIIKGFKGNQAELRELGKTIRQKCSVGGAEKDGEIILQGDIRDKVVDILAQAGHKSKKAGS
jgi:translation initiation factor 1